MNSRGITVGTDILKRDEAQNGIEKLICSFPRSELVLDLNYGCENSLQCVGFFFLICSVTFILGSSIKKFIVKEKK